MTNDFSCRNSLIFTPFRDQPYLYSAGVSQHWVRSRETLAAYAEGISSRKNLTSCRMFMPEQTAFSLAYATLF